MSLFTTYYDVLVKRDPKMVQYVRRDVQALGIVKEPFESVDDYSKYFEEYISNVIDDVLHDIYLKLSAMGINNHAEIEKHMAEFQETAKFKNLLYSKHADYVTLTNFELFNKKTFHVQENLVEHLSQTSLDVESKLLKLPFESCLFTYNSEIAIRAFQALNENESIVGLNTPVSVFAHSLPADNGERKIVFTCWHADHHNSFSFAKRELLLREGWNITQVLSTDWDDIAIENGESDKITLNETIFGSKGDDKVFYEKGLMFFRILINTILYLSSNDPDLTDRLSNRIQLQKKLNEVKNAKKIRKIKKKINRLSELNYSSVGDSLPPIIVDKKYDSKTGNTNNSISKSSKRFIVRGHWRQLSSEKSTWIKPYYKGDEMADLINKPYEIK